MRAVIETNVWVSAVLNPHGAPALVMEAFRKVQFLVMVSQPLLDELWQVLMRPRLMRRMSYHPDLVQELINLCRDPHDNMFLETAIKGGAEYLVTRDDDLKRDPELLQKMAEFGIQVVSVQRFLNQLGAE
ncbi:MAG: putative toxin-antitoxin system toxin component, PIN family [Armatimonadetes bacterium]|jgi:predicted nucleic acid-binding protein|nr:putative toxin-antitoxin system toxin component, PIN family [Armatimonadota bacterium]CUU36176.1 hypothetical protein DCOP10_116256 [Armatimonadetes bacterium DC]CUU36959.1 hypothetical protein GXSOP10_12974 [Armatimonadetes bacterium GXS]